MTRRVLVTGAQGFLGRYLVANWLTADPQAIVFGVGRSARLDGHFTHDVHWGDVRVQAPLPAHLAEVLRNDRYRYFAIDVTNTPAFARLLSETRPEIVVHLAAALRDDPPVQLVHANIGTVASLFESILVAGIDSPRIVFGSSGFIYGHIPGRIPPLREDALCQPIDPYSATKRAAEELGRILAERDGLAVLWARIFNPVGPGQDERHLCGFLARQLAAIAQGVQRPVVRAGSLDTTRDFVDVRDVASALRLLAVRGQPGSVYNVASGRETSGQEVFDTLTELSGLIGLVSIERQLARRVDIQRHFASIERLAVLGYECEYSLKDSLADVLSYYRDCVSAEVAAAGRPSGT